MPVGIRVGQLNRRVTIQQPVVVSGIQKWADLATVWAAIAPVTGNEVARSLGPTNVVMSTVTIRYRSDIKPRMRLLYKVFNSTGALLTTRVLEVVSVITPDEQQIALELVVKETQT